MNFLEAIGILLITLIGMECFSWFIHKFLFHGPLWFIHKTHHEQRKGFFELNDIFSFGFAGLALYLMYSDFENLGFVFWTGAGISLYGLIYFIFHDWFIHNRFKSFHTKNSYLSGIRRAHKMHHKSMAKNPSEEFGLLWVSRKYFRKT